MFAVLFTYFNICQVASA